MCEFFEKFAAQLGKRSLEGDVAEFHQYMKGLVMNVKRSFVS